MKILMIAPEPFLDARGTPLSVFQRSKTLSELNNTVDIVTYHLGKDVNIKNINIYRSFKIPFIKSIAVGPSFFKILLDLLLFIKSLHTLLTKRYDVIHAHEEAAFLGCVLKKIFRIPLIYDMHSYIPQQLINYNFTHNDLLLNITGFFQRWMIENSDLIITICPYLEKIVHYIENSKKVYTIENIPYLDGKEDLRSKDVTVLKERLGIKNSKVVLYTGTFAYNQGIEMLLKTVLPVSEKIRDIMYVLVGGEPKKIAEMKALAASLNIDNHVIFTGKLPLNEIPKYIDMADVLVAPRINGINVPSKIYSYLKSEKPIVATNIIAHTQVLDENVAVLTDPDPESLTNGIIRLIEDTRLGKKIGRRGRRLAETRNSYNNFFIKTKQAYESIVHR